MKLKRAIEVIKDNIDFFEADGYQECADAVKLGIEALKKIDYLHVTKVLGKDELLPGETKEKMG